MMHLITGGSGSGKSAYAERQVMEAGEKKRIYVATMMPYGEEGKMRVKRHRDLLQIPVHSWKPPLLLQVQLPMLSSFFIPPFFLDRKSTRLNSSHLKLSRMPSSA